MKNRNLLKSYPLWKNFYLTGGFVLDSKNGFWVSFFNFIVEPSNLVAVLCTSLLLLCCNFLPLSVKENLGFYNFLIKYNVWIFVIFLISFFLSVYRLFSIVSLHIRDKKNLKLRDEIRRNLVYSDNCWKILLELYKARGKPVKLSYDVVDVRNLEYYGLISKFSNNVSFEDGIPPFTEPLYYFVLVPLAKDYIEDRLSKECKQSLDNESN